MKLFLKLWHSHFPIYLIFSIPKDVTVAPNQLRFWGELTPAQGASAKAGIRAENLHSHS